MECHHTKAINYRPPIAGNSVEATRRWQMDLQEIYRGC